MSWKFAVVATGVLFAGCAFLPKTPDELRSAQGGGTKVCTQLEPQEAARRIQAGWRGCHFMGPVEPQTRAVLVGTVPILVQDSAYAGDFIRIEQAGPRLSVVKGGNSSKLGVVVQLLADIEQTATCKAEVTVRGLGPIWESRAKGASYYLENPDTGCEP